MKIPGNIAEYITLSKLTGEPIENEYIRELVDSFSYFIPEMISDKVVYVNNKFSYYYDTDSKIFYVSREFIDEIKYFKLRIFEVMKYLEFVFNLNTERIVGMNIDISLKEKVYHEKPNRIGVCELREPLRFIDYETNEIYAPVYYAENLYVRGDVKNMCMDISTLMFFGKFETIKHINIGARISKRIMLFVNNKYESFEYDFEIINNNFGNFLEENPDMLGIVGAEILEKLFMVYDIKPRKKAIDISEIDIYESYFEINGIKISALTKRDAEMIYKLHLNKYDRGSDII
jgi:hypothetical protein